jgi:hypothetical protein
MSVLPNPGPAQRKILTPYVMIWVAIASFALVYLTLLGLKPHMFARAGSSDADLNQKIVQAQRDMERGLADLDPLRRTVGEVKMDVANLKVAVEEASVRDQVLLDKVAALENAAPNASAQAPAGTAAGSHAAAVPPTPKHKPSTTVGPTVRSGPTGFAAPVGPTAEEVRARRAQKTAKVINGGQSGTESGTESGAGGIETGSIERKSQRAATVPPATKNKAAAKMKQVGVLLATGPSIDSLRLNWSILTDRYADAVRNLQPRYLVKGKAGNRTYRLVAGPVASTAEANSLCKDMETRGMPCEVSVFAGNAL